MNIIAYERVEREWSGGQEIMEVAYRLLDRLLEREEKIIAIGVATPGPVDVKKGRLSIPGLFSRNTESGCGRSYTEALWNSGVPGS